jgi:hypothetical protein
MGSQSEQLCALLQSDYNPDYWSDVVLPGEVAPLARSMTAADWQELVPAVAEQAIGWCKQLADAARYTGNAFASPPLVAMLKREEAEAGAAAATALLEIGYVWTPEESLVADLDRHIGSAPAGTAAPLQRLRCRLPS